jgi:SAM-dependent methyltransferase
MDPRDASLGFYRVWLGAVGAREGLFDALTRARSAGDLARAKGLDERAVGRWCRAAHAVGLLARDPGGRFRMPLGLVRPLARPDDPAYLGHHYRYLAEKSLGFGAMSDLLRGKADRTDLSRTYAVATSWDHLAFFELALPRDAATRRLLARGADVLDLGAGLGAWTREARRRFPRSRFVMAEVSPGEGQLAVADVPERAFDVVYLGEVLGASGDPAAPLATAARALRPGGVLHALEGLAPPRDREPRGWGERLVLAMDFDFALDGSRYLTTVEAAAALRAAGLVRCTMRDLGGSLFHLRAQRPKRSSR